MTEEVTYSLEITPEAYSDLEKLDKTNAKRISSKLIWITANVTNIQHEELQGNWAGYYRYRIGDYRVIYSINHTDKVMVVDVIGHRKDVYDE